MAVKTPKKQKDEVEERAHPLNAANPSASLAGRVNVLQIDGCPLKITVTDGARATLEVSDHGPLDQAQLQAAGKLINAAIQGTY